MGIRLSVVIPTFNMSRLLRRGLEFLENQTALNQSSSEVVVVDDGSDDETRTVVSEFSSRIRLQYVHRPRDSHSCRARARNLGLAASQGEMITFLDTGVVVDAGFVERTAKRLKASDNAVIIHRVMGLFAVGDTPELEGLTPGNFSKFTLGWGNTPRWNDIRIPALEGLGNELGSLPAPWVFGWSCALTVPRRFALLVNGFDEQFLGWGAEDSDFCLRLHEHGARFFVDTESSILHIPHTVVVTENPVQESERNALRLHWKARSRESELFLVASTLGCNPLIRRLDSLALELAVPPCSCHGTGSLGSPLFGKNFQSGLLCGTAQPELAEALNATHILVHRVQDEQRFQAALPGKVIERFLGVHLCYENHFFDWAVIGDGIRLYPPAIQAGILREMTRVAKEVVLLFAAAEQRNLIRLRREYREASGWGWTSESQLLATAEQLGLSALPTQLTDELKVWRLTVAAGSRDPEALLSPL